MDKKPIFEVTENDVGQRLDNYLMKQRKHIEKSNWYKLIRKGLIRVNGKRVKPLHKLAARDAIRIPASIFFVESNKAKVDPKWQSDLMQHVVIEDKDYLLLNKPAGLAVHTGTGHKMGVIEIIGSIPGYENTQLAHRLDKDTSGCLLLAKSRQALVRFQSALKTQQVTKTYDALLLGALPAPVTVEQPLFTDHREGGIRTVLVDPRGKPAISHFNPIVIQPSLSWVKCQIETGRTHQIRVHAQYLGCPVLGDSLYGKSDSTLDRSLYLHASSLQFLSRDWQVDVPDVFKQTFNQFQSVK
ncbi:RluA family pseudouridine synthase [Marinicella litoralis]|uniref:Pseudouridine synthase n=1 Tax=Marinicella litoralis TaxID=644220 RepID=A0A4R6XSQ9_9GAMM|nr:RluA family pseudouridine synthase [Marinicella litoralis]TDR19378.1 ribosomal large subunit pseudouridine synthase C [Marinicella litoralis]